MSPLTPSPTKAATSTRIRFPAPTIPLALAFTLALFISGCITERTPSGPAAGAASRSAVRTGSAPVSSAPVAAPASAAQSITSAARVAIVPLLSVPYDGVRLPRIAPDGSRLLTRSDAPAAAEAADSAPRAAPAALRYRLYDLRAAPPVEILFDDAPLAGLEPSPIADARGFVFISPNRSSTEAVRLRYDDHRVEPLELPQPLIPGIAADAAARLLPASDPDTAWQVRNSASLFAASPSLAAPDAPSPVLVLSIARGRMALFDPATSQITPLAPRSIAGCWAVTPQGPAVILSTSDGLVMQAVARDATGWRAAQPARLLRERWVPVATTDPQRPFILVGPGPKERPELLQVVAMSLVP